jgi:hypothetical protein
VIAVVCCAVVLVHAGAATSNGYELRKPAPPATTPEVYQAAVHLCAHTYVGTPAKPHWCGELAYDPGFDLPSTIANAAQVGMQEFADPSEGAGLGSSGNCCLTWQWNYQIGLWGAHSISHWWQSALDLETLVRYAEVTHDTSPDIQTVLLRTYQRESGNTPGLIPFALANDDFTDDFMDDTAWWGLAWLEAAKYELNDLHDTSDAKTFLWLAEHDADYVSQHGRMCGGIEWQIGTPPDTITSAEFVSLTAGLSDLLSSSGPFHNPHRATAWLGQAQHTMSWLQKSGLINLSKGKVEDRLNQACNQVLPGPKTYTQGEVANAFVQLGIATHNSSYFMKAAPFLRYVPSEPAGMMSHGVVEEPCERDSDGCTAADDFLDMQVFKGILMQAYANFTLATGDQEFVYFIRRQASAVVQNAVSNGNGVPAKCQSPSNCQFVFYWGWPISPVRTHVVTQGTEFSALSALIAELALPPGEQIPY